MADYTPFPAKIVTPEGVLFEGAVRELDVTGVGGGLAILARRAPVVTDLKIGRVKAQLVDGTWRTWATDEGFAQASDSTATVVVEEAIALEDVDADAAAKLIADGTERMEAATTAGDESEQRAASREIAWGEHLAGFVAANS